MYVNSISNIENITLANWSQTMQCQAMENMAMEKGYQHWPADIQVFNCQTITLPSLIFLLFISFSACSRMATRKMCQDSFFRLVTMLWRQACPGFVGNFRGKILEHRFFIFPPNDSHVCLLLARLGKDFIGKAAIVEAKSKKVSWTNWTTITRAHKKLQYNRQVEMFCKIYFGRNSNVP